MTEALTTTAAEHAAPGLSPLCISYSTGGGAKALKALLLTYLLTYCQSTKNNAKKTMSMQLILIEYVNNVSKTEKIGGT